MSLDTEISAYFVTTPAGGTGQDDARVTVANDMTVCLKQLKKVIPLKQIKQIKASEGYALIAAGQLTKRDVFIFDRFEGDFFTQLQRTKAVILGPRCLTSCLLKDEPIPLGNSPIYTVAMRDMHISASGISCEEKEKLRQLIQWMGGYYFNNFGRQVTHLISNTIKSTKYEQATLHGKPVMHVDWVKRVWQRSCVDNVLASDEEFSKYRLPIFYGTNITCTGLSPEQKEEVKRLVNENGGTYHPAFRSHLVDIVITPRDKTNTDKYQAAVRYKKDILTPEWIFESVEKGFALPTKKYQVKVLKASTPTKSDRSLANFTSADTTQLTSISRISMLHPRQALDGTVNDTVRTDMELTPEEVPLQAPPVTVAPSTSREAQRELLKKTGLEYRTVLDEICPKKAKKAGSFLDGCCIYLSGFRADEKEKLNRILNVGGATRYDMLNEKITHIIVGQLDNVEMKTWLKDDLLTAVHVVRLAWLLESINLQQPASEIIHRISLPKTTQQPDAPSPSSKRTLRSMNHSFKQPAAPPKKKLFEDIERLEHPLAKPLASSTELPLGDEENNLIAQYSQEYLPVEMPPVPTEVERDNVKENVLPKAKNAQSSTLANASSQMLPPPLQAPQPTDMTTPSIATTIDYENLDFFRGMSLYVHKDYFTEEILTQVLSSCEAAQGNVVSSNFCEVVDFAIVCFERTFDVNSLPVKARTIVTELYIEDCMKRNELLPIEYFHKHIPITADAQPLKGMIIVISTYTSLERDFIESAARLMGTTINDNFVKKERPLLVCPAPEGKKYLGAIKWGYPVVLSAWLVQCAVEGRKMPYDDYLVGNCARDFPNYSPSSSAINSNDRTTPVAGAAHVVASVVANSPVNTRVASSATKNNPAHVVAAVAANTPVNTRVATSATTNSPAHVVAAVAANTPVTTLVASPDTANSPMIDKYTPLRNKRVSELAGAVGGGIRSPHTPIASNSNNKSGSNSPDSPYTPINSMRPSIDFDMMEEIANGIEDPRQRATLMEVIAEFRNNQTPELERIRRQACTPIRHQVPTPKGIPEFCTTPAFQKRMAEASDRRWLLALKYIKPETPIEEVRRRMIQGIKRQLGVNDSDDEANETEQQTLKKTTASSSAKHFNDKTPSLTENLTTLTSSKERQSIEANCTAAQKTRNTPVTSRVSDSFVPNTQSPTGMGQGTAVIGKSSIGTINFEETILNNSSPNAAAGSAKRASKPSTPTLEATNSPLQQITEYLKNLKTPHRENLQVADLLQPRALGNDFMNVEPFESEQFGAGTEQMVGWRDPAEFTTARRSRGAMMQYRGTPLFSISCGDDQYRQDIIEKILKLGGKVCENLISYDPACTHFLCERPNRAEKILGCISSGKWVLNLKYIEESFAKDAFVDEELFEWGNSKALNPRQLTSDEQSVALAANRWRQLLATKGNDAGAFVGFRVILRISEKSFDAIKNVIRAGKGEVIDAQPPYSEKNGAHLANYCFVDIKKAPLTRADYNFLCSKGVKIYSQLYINGYLMNCGEVDATKYEIKM